MAYSVLNHAFVCLDSNCGQELEIEEVDARVILGLVESVVEELVYA